MIEKEYKSGQISASLIKPGHSFVQGSILASAFESSKLSFGPISKALKKKAIIPEKKIEEDSIDKKSNENNKISSEDQAHENKIEGIDKLSDKKKEKKKKRKRIAEETNETEKTITTIDDKTPEEKQKSDRTVFVGNVPLLATSSQLRQFFSKNCGPTQSVRIRSVAVEGCAVNQPGNQNLVKKVCVNQKKFLQGRDSCNAYIVFMKTESVPKALELNGKEFMGKYLRVDREDITKDAKRSVFLGGLSFTTSEDDIRNHFATKLERGVEAIESVRIIRDKESGLGKGFGYILFKDFSSVPKALKLNDTKLLKRKIRVQVCGKRYKSQNQNEESTKKSFEGERARPGAELRIFKKSKNDLSDIPSKQMKKKISKFIREKPKKEKHAARKAKQALALKENDGKTIEKKKVHAKKIMKDNNKDKVVKEKPKKEKHAARKAKQALALKEAAAAKTSTESPKENPKKKDVPEKKKENVLEKKKENVLEKKKENVPEKKKKDVPEKKKKELKKTKMGDKVKENSKVVSSQKKRTVVKKNIKINKKTKKQ